MNNHVPHCLWPKGFPKTPFEADKAGLSKDYKTRGKAWDRGLSMETCGARKRGRLPRGGHMFKSPIPEE